MGAKTRTRRRGVGSVTSYRTKAGLRWRWQLRMPIDPNDEYAEIRTRGKGGYRTAAEADDALAAARRDAAAGVKLAGIKPTFEAFAGSWIDGLDLAPATIAGYRRQLVHANRHIGKVRVDRITATKLRATYSALSRDGLSTSTVRKVHVTVGQVLSAAVEDGLVTTNHARKKSAAAPTSKGVAASAEQLAVWSPEQLRAFLSWARDYEASDATLWEVFAATGMRRSEVLALRWSDIDLDGARLSVRQALDTEAGGFKLPKSGKARVVDLDAGTVSRLRAWKAARGALALAFARGDSLVFGGIDGAARNPRSVSQMFARRVDKAREQLGREALPLIRLHDLRHTHATMLLAAGENPKVVQERLGHASITITLDIYAHVTPTMQRAAADRFGALMGG